jgi:uncharacterized protein YfaS (alpha-2-macroglobulin family)
VLQEFGLKTSFKLADRTLEDSLDTLLVEQNEDGGWGWWKEDESDAYVTAYARFGLVRARDGGVIVNE